MILSDDEADAKEKERTAYKSYPKGEGPPPDRVRKLGPSVALVHGRHGHMIVNPKDQYAGPLLMEYGEFGEQDCDLFAALVEPNSLVLDVGANIGGFTIPLASNIVPNGLVVAFEPQPQIFYQLAGNVAINGLRNVECYNMAVGHETGSIVVPHCDYDEPNNYGGITMQFDGPGRRVPMDFIDNMQMPNPALIKIDVEGMEIPVLLGAQKTIERARPFLYVENDRPEMAANLINTLWSMDYNLYWFCPYLYEPDNFFGNTKNIFPYMLCINMIGVHKSVSIDKLPASALTDPVTEAAPHRIQRENVA